MKFYFRTTVLLIICFLVSCDNQKVFKTDYVYIIKGRCYYKSFFTGVEVNNSKSITTTLRSADGGYVNPGVLTMTTTANPFEFGPIKPGEYVVSSKFLDETTGINYEGSETVVVDNRNMEIDVELKGNSGSKFQIGKITYTDVFSNLEVTATNNVNGQITPLGQLQPTVNPNFFFSGGSYTVGPVTDISYDLELTFTDPYGMPFKFADVIQVNNSSPRIVNKNYKVERVPNTTIVAYVQDQQTNYVPGAIVYLYNNYNLLLKYKANTTAALATATADSKGRTLFPNLEATKYYLYAIKIIGDDTLSSLDPGFDPNQVAPLVKDGLNSMTVRILD